jgi:hypothetical protein
VNTVRYERFDTPASNGWTSGTVGDAPNPADDWQHAGPYEWTGNVGSVLWSDPASSFSAPFCWGTRLATPGTYSANAHSYLRSPVLNCSSATNTRLRFQSWATVEGSARDQIRVLVNGVELYQNGPRTRNDIEWGTQEYDISSLADHNASVQVEFRLRSNGTNQLGGWNIDDFRLFYLSPIIPPCPAPVTYCQAAPNSVGGGAFIAHDGHANLQLNDLVLRVAGCPPFTSGMFYYGANQTLAPFGDGFRCVSGTVFRLPASQVDAFGDAAHALDHAALPTGGQISAGQTWYFQFWYRDAAAGGAGFNLSNGLSVAFCP